MINRTYPLGVWSSKVVCVNGVLVYDHSEELERAIQKERLEEKEMEELYARYCKAKAERGEPAPRVHFVT